MNKIGKYEPSIRMGYNTYKRPWVALLSTDHYGMATNAHGSIRRFASKAACQKACDALNKGQKP